MNTDADLDTDYEPIPMETYWMIGENADPIPVQGCYNGRDWSIVGHGRRRLGIDVFLSEADARKVGETAKINSRHFREADYADCGKPSWIECGHPCSDYFELGDCSCIRLALPL